MSALGLDPTSSPAPETGRTILTTGLQRMVETGGDMDVVRECEAMTIKMEVDQTAGFQADGFFSPLKLALACGSPPLVRQALEMTNQLVVNKALVGGGPDPFQPEAGRCLMDTVAESVCEAVDLTDSETLISILVVLLSTVTTTPCHVHGSTLLLLLRTALTIHREADDETVHRTCSDTLKQVLNVVAQRMELSSASLDGMVLREGSAPAPVDPLRGKGKVQVVEEWVESLVLKLVDDVCREVEKDNPAPQVNELGAPIGRYGWCIVCRKAALHYCLATSDPVCSKACKLVNMERLKVVDSQDDTSTAAPESAPEQPVEQPETDTLNVFTKDALVAFSSLCKYSMLPPPAGGSATDPEYVRGKKLSLELIQSMLKNCGPVFRSSEKFLSAMKSMLCISLVKNSVSPVPRISQLSLAIFLALMANFKDHLKAEIGVFIEQVFLRILQSGNSTFQHKFRVLQVFHEFCTDAQTALDLFLNFDCDVNEKNIFERTIDCLAKIAQGKYTSAEHCSLQPQQEHELRMLALSAIVTLMGSIVDWARRMSDGEVQREDTAEEAKVDMDMSMMSVASVSTFSTLNTVDVNSIEASRKRKMDLAACVAQFNLKPKKGMEMLIHHGFVQDEPREIAALLRNPDVEGFSKTQLGDYLGDHADKNRAVLQELANSHEFVGMDLHGAMTAFLGDFRLPGEAQKIDRMVEAFAGRYYAQCPEGFADADAVYVLSFAMIMLQTDLQKPAVTNKMTKESFRAMNRDGNYPEEFLDRLYDKIATQPFSLGEDDEARIKEELKAGVGSVRKTELFLQEFDTVVRNTECLLDLKSRKSGEYISAHSVDYVKPIFEVICWPMLATLSVLLESNDNKECVEACLDGFKHCIRVSGRFGLDNEREAFVSSLAKFTFLHTLKEMSPKNINCIKALLTIGLSEGNCLAGSWKHVLQCVSQLERLQIISANAKEADHFGGGSPMQQTSSGFLGSYVSSLNGPPESLAKRRVGTGASVVLSVGAEELMTEQSNSEQIASEIDASSIDLLFHRSSRLDSAAIEHFVRELCQVSKEELEPELEPRVFSLSRLLDVADTNMDRVRLVWSKIWRVLSEHFTMAAMHPNTGVSLHALDALRQLAMRFLDKVEISGFHFQREFMRPFEVAMGSRESTAERKELILNIISHLIQARGHHIMSGWGSVLSIICMGAGYPDPLNSLAYTILEGIVVKHNALCIENLADTVKALVAFGKNSLSLERSLGSISCMVSIAKSMADELKTRGSSGHHRSDSVVSNHTSDRGTGASSSSQWMQLLQGFAQLILDKRREIRTRALDGLFDTLRDHGGASFDGDTWHVVFAGVLMPLFDDIHFQLSADNQLDRQWIASVGAPTCLAALTALIRLCDVHWAAVSTLLSDVLKLIDTCTQHGAEQVARIGVEGLKQLLAMLGPKCTPEMWLTVAQAVRRMLAESMPQELQCKVDTASTELPFDSDRVVGQCVVQLLLIDAVRSLLRERAVEMPGEAVQLLLEAIQESQQFAADFNVDTTTRIHMKRLGFMADMRHLPGLLKQEREATTVGLETMFAAVQAKREDVELEQLTARLIAECTTIMAGFARKEQQVVSFAERRAKGEVKDSVESVELERDVAGMRPIVVNIVLKGLHALPAPVFRDYAGEVFPALIRLVASPAPVVRSGVQDILHKQITPMVVPEDEPDSV